MSGNMKHIIALLLVVGVISMPFLPTAKTRTATAATNGDYTAQPPFLPGNVAPLVMLAMSKDHKLFYKAYTDYSDLDGDGSLDTTYEHSIDYYGYFDCYKCYKYQSNRFEPVRVSDNNDKVCDQADEWSGNFLNWAAMARIDTLRKVLYGGYRSTDSNTETVLERTFIPQDAHSWVKIYTPGAGDPSVSDVTPFSKSTISICNTTKDAYGNPPLMRVAEGSQSGETGWPRWSSNERWQCACDGEVSNGSDSLRPDPTTELLGDYNVRVQVCVSGLLGSEKCKTYPNGNIKPYGLLQSYGESDSMYFGLMTGSYTKNKSGGVLRKNVGSITDEINSTSGIFTGTAGIIDTLNNIEIVRYNYGDGTYNSTDNCSWGLSSFNDGQCTNWGNPIGEIYYETLRYFSGKTNATSAFSTDDSGIISALSPVTWSDPYGTHPYCSNPFVMVISDTSPSFDSDQIPGSYFNSFSGDLSVNVDTETDTIGTNESLTGDYFIGQTGTSNDETCTAKTVASDLGECRGLCPEEPGRQGSYYLAGLSHWGKTTDLRTDLTDSNFEQSTTTYSIALSSPLPEIELSVSGNTVEVMPTCFDNHTGRNCALVHFEVLSQTASSGSFYVNWEDSEQGGDYDMDADCILYYEISGNQITFRVETTNGSTPYDLDLGYVVSGTTDDGVHLISSNDGNWFSNRTCSGTETCNDGDGEGRYDSSCSQDYWCGEKTHTAGTTAASNLKNPLWYAAKWGGYEDKNANDLPDQTAEWDEDADGTPDTYFYVTNPLQLEAQLGEAFASILERMSSGTAAAVVADSQSGVGGVYQAIFYPKLTDLNGKEVSWIGNVKALWLDTYGNIREDSDGDGVMDMTSDNIIRFYFDENNSRTRVKTYTDTDGDGEADSGSETIVEVGDILPIWDAGESLAARDLTLNPRTIKTWVDVDDDGVMDSGENILLNTSNASTLRPYLAQVTNTEAETLIDYVHGYEQTGYRSRTIDVNGTDQVWKLGDIVYSTPTVVGKPKERYEVIYGDNSYADFKQQYKDRRQVIYVGSNDGMLHAFNGGFYDESAYTFSDATGYALGEELWAYVPYNLLPHLQWLGLEDYNHVYYVDLKPKVVDAKIFADDATHPDGWGTVLIGGMRFGGGTLSLTEADVNYDWDGDTSIEAGVSRTFRSAYFAIDITDPLNPDVLWEFTDANLGFTTSYPAIVYTHQTNKTCWMAFGSGPTDYDGTSGQLGRTYVVNLLTGEEPMGGSPIGTNWGAGNNSFMGDASSVDVDIVNSQCSGGSCSYRPDVFYIGDSLGTLWRISCIGGTWAGNQSALLSLGSTKPIVAGPAIAEDDDGRMWIYFGTGKLFAESDQLNTDTQSLVGVKEPLDWGDCDSDSVTNELTIYCGSCLTGTTVLSSNLLDTTNYTVFEGGSVDTDNDLTNGTESTFSGIESDITQYNAADTTYDGWIINMTGGERCVTKPTVLGGLVTFSTYLPDVSDICKHEGDSYLSAIYYKTGTASYESVIGTDDTVTVVEGGETKDKIKRRTSLGYGVASSPSLHVGKRKGAKVIIQTSTGEIVEVDQESLPGAYRSRPLHWVETN